MTRQTKMVFGTFMNVVITISFVFLFLWPPHVQRQCMCDGQHFAYVSEAWLRLTSITRVMPVYPEEAVRQGIQGVIEVLIDRDNVGRVARAKINPQVHPLLRRAAAEAVRGWRFRPEVVNPNNPRPVICWFGFLTFRFVIEDGQGRIELNEIPEGLRTAGRPTGIFKDADETNWVI